MAMFDKLLDNLKASRKTIVFTEGTDARILSAAAKLLSEDLMDVILCGNADEVRLLLRTAVSMLTRLLLSTLSLTLRWTKWSKLCPS